MILDVYFVISFLLNYIAKSQNQKFQSLTIFNQEYFKKLGYRPYSNLRT